MKTSRLNIIQIVCHDLGRHLGCYGSKVRSPHLDEFAREGVLAPQAFCASAVCSPSRGCLMTGQHATTHGMVGLAHFGWNLAPDVRTLVDEFNDGGFLTVHCGFQHERHALKNRYARDTQTSWAACHTENAISDAIEFLESYRAGTENDAPFYLNIGTTDVHQSVWNKAERVELYGGAAPHEDIEIPAFLPDEPPIREMMARFQASIGWLDRQCARLFAAIKKLGFGRDTLVVFTTDHGIAGMRGKGTLYDAGLETALLMQLPQELAWRGRLDGLISNIDIAPTLLEAAGLPIPSRMQGRSFWHELGSGEPIPQTAIFAQWNCGGLEYHPQRAIRTPDWLFIRSFEPHNLRPWAKTDEFSLRESYENSLYELWPPPTQTRPEIELYNVQNDPIQTQNLALKSEFAPVVADLEAQISRWMHEVNDPVLRGETPVPTQETGFGL